MKSIFKFSIILFIAFISFLNFSTNAYAQKEISWDLLADYDFEMRYDSISELHFRYPLFSDKVKELEGEAFYITGYVIPVDVESNYYVLSAFPFANCFFCGAAGPESVIEMDLKPGHRRFKTDERLTFKGVFKLNAMDIYQLSYQMGEAELYEPKKGK